MLQTATTTARKRQEKSAPSAPRKKAKASKPKPKHKPRSIDLSNEIERKFFEKTGENFSAYYEKFRPKLIWYLQKNTNDRSDAEMYADQAWANSIEKLDLYTGGKAQFSTWVFTIAKNLNTAGFKRRNRMQTLSIDGGDDDEGLSLKNVIPDPVMDYRECSNEQDLFKKKADLALRSMSKLSEKHRTVLVMRHVNGMQYEAIAYVLNKQKLEELFTTRDDCMRAAAGCMKDLIEIVSTNNEERHLSSEWREANGLDPIPESVRKALSEMKKLGVTWEDLNYNLSTVKSQIRMGRRQLRELVAGDFERMEEEHALSVLEGWN